MSEQNDPGDECGCGSCSDSGPLSRARQIELMQGAQERHEAAVRRALASPEVRRVIRNYAERVRQMKGNAHD